MNRIKPWLMFVALLLAIPITASARAPDTPSHSHVLSGVPMNPPSIEQAADVGANRIGDYYSEATTQDGSVYTTSAGKGITHTARLLAEIGVENRAASIEHMSFRPPATAVRYQPDQLIDKDTIGNKPPPIREVARSGTRMNLNQDSSTLRSPGPTCTATSGCNCGNCLGANPQDLSDSVHGPVR